MPRNLEVAQYKKIQAHRCEKLTDCKNKNYVRQQTGQYVRHLSILDTDIFGKKSNSLKKLCFGRKKKQVVYFHKKQWGKLWGMFMPKLPQYPACNTVCWPWQKYNSKQLHISMQLNYLNGTMESSEQIQGLQLQIYEV